jgi:hypothetical protein
VGNDVVDIESRPGYATRLLNWPWVLIRFRCDHCHRRGDAKLAACAARYGEFVTIGELLQIFRRSCPNSPEMRQRRQQKYGVKCTGYVADLGVPPPPDLPPAMAAWTVIEGGKKQA